MKAGVPRRLRPLALGGGTEQLAAPRCWEQHGGLHRGQRACCHGQPRGRVTRASSPRRRSIRGTGDLMGSFDGGKSDQVQSAAVHRCTGVIDERASHVEGLSGPHGSVTTLLAVAPLVHCSSVYARLWQRCATPLSDVGAPLASPILLSLFQPLARHSTNIFSVILSLFASSICQAR